MLLSLRALRLSFVLPRLSRSSSVSFPGVASVQQLELSCAWSVKYPWLPSMPRRRPSYLCRRPTSRGPMSARLASAPFVRSDHIRRHERLDAERSTSNVLDARNASPSSIRATGRSCARRQRLRGADAQLASPQSRQEHARTAWLMLRVGPTQLLVPRSRWWT